MVVHTPVKSPAMSPTHKRSIGSAGSAASPAQHEDLIPGDELTRLLIEIKTAHPEYGFKRVHDIVHERGGNYARVNIKRVQRYLHKLGLGTATSHPGHDTPERAHTPADSVDRDELIALIKAIKFAHAAFGVKRVHAQILTHGGKFTHVSIKRVKKYMHQLGLATTSASSPHEDDDDDSDSDGAPKRSGGALQKTTIKLMTIGGESKSERNTESTDGVKAESQSWLPVKLDEPASKLEQFPYQAVIRMTTSEEGDAQGSMGEIYKIQVAVEADGSLSTIHPMLVYNKPRNRKTFLHPDSPAYLPVQRLIANMGLQGTVGGSKAYFWGRYFQVEDMLYINTDKLAPFQQW